MCLAEEKRAHRSCLLERAHLSHAHVALALGQEEEGDGEEQQQQLCRGQQHRQRGDPNCEKFEQRQSCSSEPSFLMSGQRTPFKHSAVSGGSGSNTCSAMFKARAESRKPKVMMPHRLSICSAGVQRVSGQLQAGKQGAAAPETLGGRRPVGVRVDWERVYESAHHLLALGDGGNEDAGLHAGFRVRLRPREEPWLPSQRVTNQSSTQLVKYERPMHVTSPLTGRQTSHSCATEKTPFQQDLIALSLAYGPWGCTNCIVGSDECCPSNSSAART